MLSPNRLILAISMAGAVTACSVSAPIAVQSTGERLPLNGTIALMIADNDANTKRGQFGEALIASFTASNFSIVPNSAFIADYGFAVAEATDGVLGGDPGAEDQSGSPDWIVKPRKPRRFDECKAQRMRASLVLFDRSSGAVAYRGSAERTECEFSDSDLTAMAETLVNGATATVSGRASNQP